MYTMHQLETPSTNTVVEKICSTSTLNPEDNLLHTQDPQKKNLLQNMYSAWNIIWRNFSKVPSAFLRNRNNPLSVTLVQNEGIISPEFFKHLTRREEPLTTDNMHIHKVSMKNALDIDEKLHGSTFHENYMERFADDTDRLKIFKEMKDYECMERIEEFMKFGTSDSFDTVGMSDYIEDRHELQLTKTTELNLLTVYYYGEDQTDHSSNKLDSTKHTENCADIKRNTVPEEKTPSGSTGKLNIGKSNTAKEPSMRSILKSERAKESSHGRTGKLLSTLLRRQKVLVNGKATAGRGVSECKKPDAVVTARGQDRVEQAKDRMERGTQDQLDDREEDRFCWRAGGLLSESIDSSDFGEIDDEYLRGNQLFPNNKVAAIVEIPKLSARARLIPGPFSDLHSIHNGYMDIKCYPEIDSFRSRLSSESSLDSEDSYCIVFETGSEESSRASPSTEDDEGVEADEADEEEEEEEEEEDEEDEDEGAIEGVDESQSDVELSTSKVNIR